MELEVIFEFMREYGIAGVATVALLIIAYTRMLEVRNADKSDQRESEEEKVKNQTLLELAKVIGLNQDSSKELALAVAGIVTSHREYSEQQNTANERLMKLSNQANIKLDTLTGVVETAQKASKESDDKLNTLTQQLIQTENRVDSNMENQAVTSKQILDALLRIESELKDIKSEFTGLGDRIEKTEQDVNAIKADFIRQTGEQKTVTPTPPAPDNQPVVMPKVEITKKTEPKNVIESNEKEDKNEASI
jgi:hypothetical protein